MIKFENPKIETQTPHVKNRRINIPFPSPLSSSPNILSSKEPGKALVSTSTTLKGVAGPPPSTLSYFFILCQYQLHHYSLSLTSDFSTGSHRGSFHSFVSGMIRTPSLFVYNLLSMFNFKDFIRR